MLKSFIASSVVACICAPNPFAQAQTEPPTPVNAMCPIGKEPIVPSAGTVEYKGKTIGICCPGCGKAFLAWDENRKDEFVTLAIAHKEPGQERHDAAPEAAETPVTWTDPYPLDTCPVSGGKLGSMGDPIVKVYDGREVRFCCAGCIAKFEADQAGYWKAIDQQIVKDQLPYYPTDTCVVMGDPLTMDGEDIAIDFVYGNRLVRLCCKMCERELASDPKAFIEKLDQATVDAQRADYPLDTCVVAGGELGSMGEPTEMVVAGRLMRFCCAACEPKAKADPAKYIAAIDKAWHAKGKFMPVDHDAEQDVDHGEAGHDDHDHDHGDHDHGN